MESSLDSRALQTLFQNLTAPHVADACVRCGVEVRCAPSDVQALERSHGSIVGRARPARHAGSVDVFLEALQNARPGDVLVVDNGGRRDESCVGDLVALEVQQAGLAGIVIWGLHRDTPEILALRLPLFSQGAIPTGPLKLEERHADALVSARVGPWLVSDTDVVLGDENGVIFLPAARAVEIAQAARGIRDTEHAQAKQMQLGTSLRAQVRFDDYLARRAKNPALTFRQYLRRLGGAVEE